MNEKITASWHELLPAYGRDYKNKRDVESAFRSGMDFYGDFQLGFKLCSIRDFAPGTKVLLRYKNRFSVTSITV
jgi:hypothetical protein